MFFKCRKNRYLPASVVATGLIAAFMAEPGYCELVVWKVPVTYYDFHSDGSCPEFQQFPGNNQDPTLTGLVLDTLDAEGRPIKNPERGVTNHSSSGMFVDNIDKWYREWSGGADTSFKNIRIDDTLEILSDVIDGILLSAYFNGLFFPIDGRGFGSELGSAFPDHNYDFTLRLHNQCAITAGANITVNSDDDSWVFIDNRLVLDNGGPHPLTTKSVSLDSFDLAPNTTYNFDVFFAERKAVGSAFSLEMSGVELINKEIVLSTGTERVSAPVSEGRRLSLGKGGSIMVPQSTAGIHVLLYDAQGRILGDRFVKNLDADINVETWSLKRIVLIRARCFSRDSRPLGEITARLMLR